MPPTFDAWLSATVRSEFVLCEPEPSKTVMGFTAVGGAYPNTYELAFPRSHQADVFVGGMYGQVVGVQENDTVLTARASLALVDANAGSFWWDEANELLYVHTTTGSNPDLFTLVQAAVRFYLANGPITLERTPGDPATAVYYLPWLTNDLPRIRRKREGLLQGGMAVPEGQVSFTNGHGAWWTLVAADGQWNWSEKPIRFYIGGGYDGLMLARDQFAQMATMRIVDTLPGEDVCTLPLQALQAFADIDLPVTPFLGDDYPHLGDGVQGTRKWIGYGRAIVPPDLTDTTSHGVYTVADAAYQTLTAVHSVWAIEKATGAWTPLTVAADYTVNLTACTVTVISGTYAHTDYTIAVDVTGLPFTRYADIVADALVRFLDPTASALDGPAFAAAAADATNELSLWIKSKRSLISILATADADMPSLGRSAMGTVQQTVEGEWTTSIWNPDITGLEVSLRRGDFASFLPQPRQQRVVSRVLVYYGYDHVREQWSVVSADDPATRYRTGSTKDLPLYTYLRSGTDAFRLAQRYQLLAGAVPVEAAFTERGARLATQPAGAKTLVTYAPAPTVAGGYVNQAFAIDDFEVVMGPKLSVGGFMNNLHGLAGKVGRWMDTSAPDWSSATPLERQISGFWTDSNGLADPGDPASAGQSIWF